MCVCVCELQRTGSGPSPVAALDLRILLPENYAKIMMMGAQGLGHMSKHFNSEAGHEKKNVLL
jgi:hypothetical protein